MTFTTPSDNPTDFGSDPTRTVTWTVVDDTGTTNNTGTVTSTIAITAINDKPSFAVEYGRLVHRRRDHGAVADPVGH